jgi:D-alanine-D-alanine ligase
MEIVYLNQQTLFNIYSYNVKQNYKELIRYECPAAISKEIETEMVQTAKKIYEVLQCKDFARIDFRLSRRKIPRSENSQTRNSNSEKIYFIEINPLPGLAPGYSDFPMIAEFNGMNYNTLVRSILNNALKRYGFHFYLS